MCVLMTVCSCGSNTAQNSSDDLPPHPPVDDCLEDKGGRLSELFCAVFESFVFVCFVASFFLFHSLVYFEFGCQYQ